MDFTNARDRPERHRVEIIEDDLCAFVPRIAPGMVRFETRGDNLAKFFSRRRRASAAGMPILFNLGGQRAAALEPKVEPKSTARVQKQGFGGTRQINRRIVSPACALVDPAVLDEKQ